jgi:hypothetical protein
MDKKTKKFSNEGLYKHMLTEATKRIGYKLIIQRLPKKNLYFIPNNIITRAAIISLLY